MKHLLLLHILVIFSIYNNIFCQNLVIIPDTLSGSLINLTLATGIREFYSGSLTKTLGYNGSYLGKTLILYKGQKVKLNRLFSGVGAVITVEVIFTALLVMVYLFAAHRRFAPSMVGVVAGATLTLGWLVTGAIDGGSMNPARSLGAAVFADTDPNALGQIWVFILFPLVGAIIGVVAWLVIDEARLEDTLLVEVPGAAAVRDAAAEIDQAID